MSFGGKRISVLYDQNNDRNDNELALRLSSENKTFYLIIHQIIIVHNPQLRWAENSESMTRKT